MVLVFFIFLWVIIRFYISMSNSPTNVLISIIFLGCLTGVFLIFRGNYFLFFLWFLVYIGGIIIIFTYVVFFSSYRSGFFNPISRILRFLFFITLKKLVLSSSILIIININSTIILQSIAEFSFFPILLQISWTIFPFLFFLLFVILLFILFFLQKGGVLEGKKRIL